MTIKPKCIALLPCYYFTKKRS